MIDELDELHVAAKLELAEIQSRIDAIQLEIDDHLVKVRILQSKKLREFENQRQVASRITLARRLPEEIYAAIFELCVIANPHWTTALACSHVCRSWRTAALNSPIIWSTMTVSPNDNLERIGHWITHSSEAPLTILLDLEGTTPSTRTIALLKNTASTAHRWRRFAVSADLAAHASEIFLELSGTRTSAPKLIELDLRIKSPGTENDLQGLADIFPSSPNFHTFSYEGPAIPFPGTLPPHIRKLNLDMRRMAGGEISLTRLLTVLQELEKLEAFSFNIDKDETDYPISISNDAPMVIHQKLAAMAISGPIEASLLLLHRMSTPFLEGLSARATVYQAPDPAWLTESVGEAFERFFARSGNESPLGIVPVKKLELFNVLFVENDFLPVLRRLPELQEIRLHDSDLPGSIVEALIESHEDNPLQAKLCPALKIVDLRWDSQLDGKLLSNLVQYRSSLSSSNYRGIEEITAINCSHISEECLLKIAELTKCRVLPSSDDYCYSIGCCINPRYRKRFMMRHFANLTPVQKKNLRI